MHKELADVHNQIDMLNAAKLISGEHLKSTESQFASEKQSSSKFGFTEDDESQMSTSRHIHENQAKAVADERTQYLMKK